jgi:phage host-nuclease inhibitor protein Gam
MAKIAAPLLKKNSNTAKTKRTSAPAPEPVLTPLELAAQHMERYSAAAKELAAIAKQAAADSAPLKAEMDEAKAALNRFADEQKDKVFGVAKTLKIAGGTIGWKLGTKTVEMPEFGPENEKHKARIQAQFVALVKGFLPDAVTEVVDSKQLIAAWEGDSVNSKRMVQRLQKLGVDVVQKDNFFATPSK